MDSVSLRKLIDSIVFLKYRYIGSYPCDLVPNLPNDTFAIINTQPSKMQGEHWIMIAKFHHQFFCRFAWSQRLQFPEEALPMDDSKAVVGTSQRLWILNDLCSFLFNFGKEEITGFHDVNVLSFISNCM